MAQCWRLMLAHHVAHLEPTLTTGTAVAGYPVGALRTLNPQERGRILMPATAIDLDFDRGAGGNHNTVDALLLVGQCYKPASTYQVWGATDAAFTVPVTYIGSGYTLLNSYTPTMTLFTNNGVLTPGTALVTSVLRYLRLMLSAAGTTTFDFGVISVGKQYSLGTDLFGGTDSGEAGEKPSGEGGHIITRKFDTVTNADAAALLTAWRRDSILDTANAYLDGWGQRAGAATRFGALAKFTDSTYRYSSEVYYGQIGLSVETAYEGLSKVTVQVRTVEVGPIRT